MWEYFKAGVQIFFGLISATVVLAVFLGTLNLLMMLFEWLFY